MFCEDCGKPVHGRFCGHCGRRIVLDNEADAGLTLADVVDGWRYESRVDDLLQWPEVRAAVDQSGRQAVKRMTGEQLLALADKLVPQPVSMEGVAAVAQIVWTRLGVKTDRSRATLLTAPIGETLVRTLCSFARRGQSLSKVSQAADGCVLEAAQPSDMWSLAGTLVVTVHRRAADATEVTAIATVTGQLFDWGKNARCLHTLFDDLTQPLELTKRAA
jgi:hypothetical protein